MRTEIIVVLDKSGSMSSIRNDTIGGFNTFLEAQRREPGEAYITMVQFDFGNATRLVKLYEGVPLIDAPPLTETTYVPMGGTPLYDALGRTINEQGARFDKATVKPEQVVLVIITDGEENSSSEFSQAQVREMIEHQQAAWGWKVTYIGANQDSFLVAQSIGVPLMAAIDFAPNAVGVGHMFAAVSAGVVGVRAVGADMSYSPAQRKGSMAKP